MKKEQKQVFTTQNKSRIIRGGKDYFELLVHLINNATESIHLQTYIFVDDETGMIVADALKSAAKRNVQVYLMADGYASQVMSGKFIAGLRADGIQFRFFEPIYKSRYFYFGRRLHHKIFVTDAKHTLVGGMNIADRYNDLPGKPAWLDFALYAEGEIAKDICVLCWKTWKGYPAKMGITPCEKLKLIYNFQETETSKIRKRRNDWVRNKNEISKTYIELFNNAQSHITILCSYFLPGKLIRAALKQAAKRGVKIRVVTAGPSDVMLAKYAERWLYDWLLRHNIELYEYQPVVLHAKVAVCDGQWFTIGSYNINDLSAYVSIELNLDVQNASLAAEMEQTLNTIILTDSIPAGKMAYSKQGNIFKQFIRWCSYKCIHIVFNLFTFYYTQKD